MPIAAQYLPLSQRMRLNFDLRNVQDHFNRQSEQSLSLPFSMGMILLCEF